MRRIILVAALSVLCGLASAAPAFASPKPVGGTRVDHLDITKQQQIESMVVLPSGGVDATFLFAGQVARISPDGTVSTLASLPPPPPGGHAFISGLARSSSGTLYALYSAGSTDLNGVWRIRPGREPERIVALPADAALNGLTLDPAQRFLYFTDSTAGRVYRAPVSGGSAVVWAQSPELAPVTFLGANGVHVRDGAVWVSSTDRGLLVRIPIERSGEAGRLTVVASDLVGIDDFTFDGHGVIAAMNAPNQVVQIAADGSHRVILTAADGLENPTCVALRSDLLYIASGAYHTMTDPNLMIVADAHGRDGHGR